MYVTTTKHHIYLQVHVVVFTRTIDCKLLHLVASQILWAKTYGTSHMPGPAGNLLIQY